MLFNRTKSVKYNYWFSVKLKANEEFVKEYKNFLNNYNDSIRFVAKIMLAAYLYQTNKEEK